MMNILHYLFDRFLGSLGWIVHTLRKSPTLGEERIVLLAVGGIGDYLLLTPLLRFYRSMFTRGALVLVGREEIRELAINCPYIDVFIAVQYEVFGRNPLEQVRVWWCLTRVSTTLLVNTDYSTAHDWMTRSFLHWARPRRSIAYDPKDSQSRILRSDYNELVKVAHPLCFEITRHAGMLNYLGARCEPSNRPELWGYRSHSLPDAMERDLRSSAYYVVFPGSYTAKKCWPTGKFVELITRLSDCGVLPVLLGGAGDRPLAASIYEEVSLPMIDLVGKTTLLDLARVIGGARFLVSNDTSAAHIGAGVGTQTFVLLGGGHWGRFFPYPAPSTVIPIYAEEFRVCHGCEWDCLYDRFRCVEEIKVDDVESMIRVYLGGGQS